jgi:tRNA(adenine34) deaminase
LATAEGHDIDMSSMDKYYSEILRLARRAAVRNEVPIGAIVVDKSGRIVGRGYNQTHAKKDGLQHAELVAIRRAQKVLGDWRLEAMEVYVTVEPCLMCLGAIGNARIKKVSYVLADPLFGSVESKLSRHRVARMFPGLVCQKLKDDGTVAELMRGFFKELRKG